MTKENHVDVLKAPPLSIASVTHGRNEIVKRAVNKDTAARSSGEESKFARMLDNEFLRKCWTIFSWTPKRCRWDPEDPPKFSLALNLLFAFVSLFRT